MCVKRRWRQDGRIGLELTFSRENIEITTNYRIIISKKRLEATKKDIVHSKKKMKPQLDGRRAHSQYTQISRPPNDQSANWKITL